MLAAPGVYRTHTHVWALDIKDSFVSDQPAWGWVALGPRGHAAGAERTPERARHAATCAAYLLEDPPRQ
jgi:hypothetical protein